MGMAAPMYGGLEIVLQIKGRAQPDTGTSGKVLSRYDPEPYKEKEEVRGKSLVFQTRD